MQQMQTLINQKAIEVSGAKKALVAILISPPTLYRESLYII